MAKIDANYQSVAQADDGNPTPLKVDPVTGKLLIDIASTASGGVVHTFNPSDSNYERLAMGVTDDANQTPMPFHTNTSGHLLIDIVVE
jgi:hypothetical protein